MNKLIRVFCLCLFLFCGLFLSAQNKSNNLKFSAFSFAADKYELSYERILPSGMGLEIDFGLIAQKAGPPIARTGSTTDPSQFNSFCFFCDDNNTEVRVNSGKQGFFFELGPKFYVRQFTKGKLGGSFYLKPELTFMHYNFEQYRIERRTTENELRETSVLQEVSISNLGAKLNTGIQWLIADALAIDLFVFVGGQGRSIQPEYDVNYTRESAMYTRLSPADQKLFPDFLALTYGPVNFGGGLKIEFQF